MRALARGGGEGSDGVGDIGLDGNAGANGAGAVSDDVVIDPVVVLSAVVLHGPDMGFADHEPTSTARGVLRSLTDGDDVAIRVVLAAGSFTLDENAIEDFLELFRSE